MKGGLRSVTTEFAAHRSDTAISVITVAELEYGVAKSDNKTKSRRSLLSFLEELDVALFDTEAARHFADVRAELFRAGTPIGPYDLLIGAHARSLGATLVTNNRREFDRIPGLKVENWAA